MIVEGYTLHLYCDDPDHPWSDVKGSPLEMGEFSGYRVRVAYREARANGWRFYTENGDRKTRCPACVARLASVRPGEA